MRSSGVSGVQSFAGGGADGAVAGEQGCGDRGGGDGGWHGFPLGVVLVRIDPVIVMQESVDAIV